MAANPKSQMPDQIQSRRLPFLQDRRLVAVSFGAVLVVGWASCAGYIAGRLVTSEWYRQAGVADRSEPSRSSGLNSTTPQPSPPPVARAAEPEPPSPPTAVAPASGDPGQVPGQQYLQVAAVNRGVAEVFVEVLARKGFPGRMAEGPDERTFRVLVGPLAKAEIPETRSALDRAGFPAFVRTY